MIFVVDDDNETFCGETLEDAYKQYREQCGMNASPDLRVYEGTEMEVTYTLAPKTVKAKK